MGAGLVNRAATPYAIAMSSWRLRTALLATLETACSDEAAAPGDASTTNVDPSSSTGMPPQPGSTDSTGDATSTTPPTSTTDSASTTSTSEVDTTTGEALVCITPTDTAGEPASWTRSHGVPSENISPGQLFVASDGSITTAFAFKGEIDLGDGPVATDGRSYRFLTRYSAAGEFAWSTYLAPTNVDSTYRGEIQAWAMGVDCAGNVVVGGSFTGQLIIQGKTLTAAPGRTLAGDDIVISTDDIFLVKFGPDGVRRWARRFGDDREQRIHGVAIQADGTIIVGGASNGTLELDGSSDAPLNGAPTKGDEYVGLLAAFDPDGRLAWKRTYASTNDVALLNLAIAADDRISMYGHAGGDTDFGGGPVVLVDDPYFIAQFESDGTHRWSSRFFDKQHQPYNVGTDATGGVVFSGTFGSNGFVARYDDTGQIAWNHDLIRATQKDTFYVFSLIVDDEVVIGGSLQGSVDFGGGALVTPPDQQRPFLARYDLAGAHLASATYDSATWARFISGDRGPDGELALVGDFKGTLDLGDGPRIALGSKDMFIHRAQQ
jgi:hypothetical protein